MIFLVAICDTLDWDRISKACLIHSSQQNFNQNIRYVIITDIQSNPIFTSDRPNKRVLSVSYKVMYMWISDIHYKTVLY